MFNSIKHIWMLLAASVSNEGTHSIQGYTINQYRQDSGQEMHKISRLSYGFEYLKPHNQSTSFHGSNLHAISRNIRFNL
jgi:hypothetical protein